MPRHRDETNRIEDDGRPWPPDNPFADGATFRVNSLNEIPTSVLVASAISGTVDDGGISDHAEGLLETLRERGPDAWMETGLLLAQYLLSGGHYDYGWEAAGLYLNQVPETLPPSLEVAHNTVASWIHAGRERAQLLLEAVDDTRLRRAVTWLLCLAVATSGLTDEQRESFLSKVAPKGAA